MGRALGAFFALGYLLCAAIPSNFPSELCCTDSMQWRKVAMIMSQVVDECRRRGGCADLHDVAERICALVEDGQLEAQGDLSTWRHSEVRLPPLARPLSAAVRVLA